MTNNIKIYQTLGMGRINSLLALNDVSVNEKQNIVWEVNMNKHMHKKAEI